MGGQQTEYVADKVPNYDKLLTQEAQIPENQLLSYNFACSAFVLIRDHHWA